MPLKTVDLTQQPQRALFTGSPQDDVLCAHAFWQSLQLLPPMESPLNSVGLEQRQTKVSPSESPSDTRSDIREAIEVYGDFDDIPPQSKSITISSASDQLSDSYGCYLRNALRRKYENRSGSLIPQTSMIGNFGEDDDESPEEAMAESTDWQRNQPEDLGGETQPQRKVSISFARKSVDNDNARGRGSVLGAGGREFWFPWSAAQNGWLEKYGHNSNMKPEEISRRKGFRDWERKKFMWSQPAKSSMVAAVGGGELNGKAAVAKQYPAYPDYCDSMQSNALIDETTTPPSPSQKAGKRGAGVQRLVGTMQVLSLFQSANLQATPKSSVLAEPDTQRKLPPNFRKHLEASPALGRVTTTTTACFGSAENTDNQPSQSGKERGSQGNRKDSDKGQKKVSENKRGEKGGKNVHVDHKKKASIDFVENLGQKETKTSQSPARNVEKVDNTKKPGDKGKYTGFKTQSSSANDKPNQTSKTDGGAGRGNTTLDQKRKKPKETGKTCGVEGRKNTKKKEKTVQTSSTPAAQYAGGKERGLARPPAPKAADNADCPPKHTCDPPAAEKKHVVIPRPCQPLYYWDS